GTIQLPISPASNVAAALVGAGQGTGSASGTRQDAAPAAVAPAGGSAVLVVGGWGSSCCDAANDLRAMLPGTNVWQFSYASLDATGRPAPQGASADDLPLPVLGDKIAAQVRVLHAAS